MQALLHAALKGLSIKPTTCTPVPALNEGAASAGGRITRPRHPLRALRCGPLLAALTAAVLAPAVAFGQTEACSFFNPFNEQCSDLDPSTCASLGGIPLGPGTMCGYSVEPGDLDNDGSLTALDVYPFALALLDPTEYAVQYPNGNINLGDFNHDGVLDGADVGMFVAALVQAPRPCQPARRYCYASGLADATGCSAYIDTCNTSLCGGANSVAEAASLAFVTVLWLSDTGNGFHVDRQAQTGYARLRSPPPNPPSTTVFFERYAEVSARPNDPRVFHHGPAAQPGTHLYRCYLVSALFGSWRFDYDDDLDWFPVSNPGWVNETGNTYMYEAEIHNYSDQMVGTPSSHCLFYNCQFAPNYDFFYDANITDSDIHCDGTHSWGIERLDVNAIGIWDNFP